MTVNVIELADANIRIARDGQLVFQSPGYALVKDSEIEVGDVAFKQAKLHPLRAHNQFWHRLSQDPLTHPTPYYRHHADLVYAHLKHLAGELEDQAEVVFAVPGSYTKSQLSLLLGVAQESPLKVVGLVDAAVAAAAASPLQNPTFYLDILLHQAVITRLDVGDSIQRSAVESLQNIGLAKLYDRWVHLVADTFIEQCRFDPLHNAETEQAIYCQLPQWLAAVNGRDEVLLEIESSGKRFQANLSQPQVTEKANPFYRQLQEALNELSRAIPQAHLLLSERLARLPGIGAVLPSYQVVAETAFYEGCERHLDFIRNEGHSLSFVTSLPVSEANKVSSEQRSSPESGTQAGDRATHILNGYLAYGLGQPLFLGLSGETGQQGDLEISESAHQLSTLYCSVLPENQTLTLQICNGAVVTVNGEAVSGTATLNPGDELVIGPENHRVQVIRAV